MLPSPAELTYFYEVAGCLNLSRASERLGVSQPSISLAIKRLEQTMNTQLFVRHKHGVTLTQAGEHLLSQVDPLLQHWNNTLRSARASHEEVQGTVTIGCRSAAAQYLIPLFMRILERHPQLKLDFKFQSSLKTSERVINSIIDVGVVNNPIPHHDLIIHPAGNTQMSFWVGEGERDIQRIDSGKAIILCEPNMPQAQGLLRRLKKTGVPVARVVTANNLDVLANMAAAGCGIAILPSCFAQSLYENRLKPVLDLPSCEYEVCLIYRYESKNVRAISTVVSMFKEFTTEI
ncbi:LysR family transcriptional regulator [Legionella sp. CNM-4043-24]|uniref:LysR family transcriptional regulator n=1 Tax=Legionella sp. CNM-4043-24 TaxID=3421646 RepID=UPI00403A8A8A